MVMVQVYPVSSSFFLFSFYSHDSPLQQHTTNPKRIFFSFLFSPDFVFDAVPYMDLMMRDLGLQPNRKQGWKDVWQPYGPADYRGCVDEWVEKHGGGKKATF